MTRKERAQMSSTYQANDGPAYERFIGRWTRRLGDAVAEAAPPGGDGAILDVACGTGSMTAALAAISSGRRIVGIDVASAYLDHARTRTDTGAAEFIEMDAQQLLFEDDAFAAAYATIALNFMSEPIAAAREMNRVVQPGGLVAVAGWDFRGGLVYQRMLWDTAAAIEPGAAKVRARIFSHPLAKPDGLGDLWQEAGIVDVTRRSLTIRMDFQNFDDYWLPLLGGQGPVGGYVAALDEATQVRVRDAVREAYLSGDADGPRSLTATAWLVTGRAT
ncbi:class I SAM-dependent methyltransferase [Roseitranquillus sediminis]|uniref:class I SAM-dependent methyltransferase n=1 Tax=Roseitranquillus sediminis TaxID=2809051 RepID=UPI001D0C77DC|nr:methyltransferase domain-containing protein [Roseitranquillus sediminis]MBM9593548.1 methyltransferase domain-containing protein [Roseitranquillus sediminis]